jgi:hypothetical protein
MPKKAAEEKINKLNKLIKIVNDGVTQTEFANNFKKIMEVLKLETAKIEKQIEAKTISAERGLKQIQDKHIQVIEQIKKDNDSSLSGFRRRTLEIINRLFLKSKVNEKLGAKLNEVDAKMATVTDGVDGLTGAKGDKGEIGEQGPAGSPDTPEEVRDKLETLKGKERLHIKAIRGLRKELNALKKVESKVIYTGASGGPQGGGHVKAYDLSASLDGSTKTFTLPAFWRIISVHSSSFPNAFRATTDYTTDADAMSITFTSEITAGTTLATGQTITVIYAEP